MFLPFLGKENVLSEGQLTQLTSYLNTLPFSDAAFSSNGIVDNSMRNSQVSFFRLNDENEWFCNLVLNLINRMNDFSYKFDLSGISDPFQYTIYDASVGGHYNWHIDMMEHSQQPQRKLTAVLQLSDASEYDGGDLQINFAGSEDRSISVPKKKNFFCVFPSFFPHRVTTVTRGIRKTIVIWSCGPEFK